MEHSDRKNKQDYYSDVPLLITESLIRNEPLLIVFHIHWPTGISDICWQMLANQQFAVLAAAVVVSS